MTLSEAVVIANGDDHGPYVVRGGRVCRQRYTRAPECHDYDVMVGGDFTVLTDGETRELVELAEAVQAGKMSWAVAFYW